FDKDPEVKRWRKQLTEQHGVSFFGLPPESVEIGPAITRWLAERQFKLKPALVIQSIDFKCANPGRKNRLLLFNGHSIPVFVERLWLMREDVKYWGPTFTLNEVIPPNSIKEIFSPPFRDDDTAGESWEFPKDNYRAGVIQSFDTNWVHEKPGWESE